MADLKTLTSSALSLLAAASIAGPAILAAQEGTRIAPGVFAVEKVTEIDTGKMPASAPRWSPDGKWIAFSTPKGNGIGMVRPDGTGVCRLTAEPGSGYKFAWSPDGSRIAFRTARREAGPRQYAMRVVNARTGEVESTSATVKDAQPPVWQRGPAGMRWISPTASGAVEGAWLGTASPAGRAALVGPPLLLAGRDGLRLHAAEAALRRELSSDPALNAVWNPEGTRVAFDSGDSVAVVAPSQPGLARMLCVGSHPAWSPDGQWLIFQITRDHSHASDDPRQHTPDTLPHLHDDKTNHRIVDSDLWIINADGTGRQPLTQTPDVLEGDPDWSADGKFIVCRTEDTGRLLALKIRRR